MTKIFQRKIKPDYLYNSESVAKLINSFMLEGKKRTAEKLVYKAIEIAKEEIIQKYGDISKGLSEIILEASSTIQIKSRRIGRTIYKFPVPLKDTSRVQKGCKGIVKVVRSKTGEAYKNLASELKLIIKGEGSETAKLKQKIEEEANSNRALASAYMKNFG